MDASDGIALLAVVVALGTAVVTWARANRAERRADETERRADRALELAESAEARADRLESIATERRDVAWEAIGARGELIIRNVGTDTAHTVEVSASKPGTGERVAMTVDVVEPNEAVTLQLTEWKQAAIKRSRSAPRGVVRSSSVIVNARVSWQSRSGVPGVQELAKLSA